MIEKWCVRCGRQGHHSNHCPWPLDIPLPPVPKPPPPPVPPPPDMNDWMDMYGGY